jgi:hypothetical protein
MSPRLDRDFRAMVALMVSEDILLEKRAAMPRVRKPFSQGSKENLLIERYDCTMSARSTRRFSPLSLVVLAQSLLHIPDEMRGRLRSFAI